MAKYSFTQKQMDYWAAQQDAAREMLAALEETREAAAAMMRTIANHPELIAEMAAECMRVGAKDGFGKRADAAIRAARAAGLGRADR